MASLNPRANLRIVTLGIVISVPRIAMPGIAPNVRRIAMQGMVTRAQTIATVDRRQTAKATAFDEHFVKFLFC